MLSKLTINVKGMHCDGCVATLKVSLGGIVGVDRAEVTIGQVDVKYDDTATTRNAIFQSIRQSGPFDIAGFSTSERR